MPTKSVIVGSAVGLHARPAAIISEAAGELDSEVTDRRPRRRAGRRQLGAADHDPRRRQGRHGRGLRRRPGGRRRDRRPGREGPRRLTRPLSSPQDGPEQPLAAAPGRPHVQVRTARRRRHSAILHRPRASRRPPGRAGRAASPPGRAAASTSRRPASSREHAAPVDVPAGGTRARSRHRAGRPGATRSARRRGRPDRWSVSTQSTTPAHPAPAQSTLAGWKSRCRNTGAYDGAGRPQPLEGLDVEPGVLGPGRHVPLGLAGPGLVLPRPGPGRRLDARGPRAAGPPARRAAPARRRPGRPRRASRVISRLGVTGELPRGVEPERARRGHPGARRAGPGRRAPG